MSIGDTTQHLLDKNFKLASSERSDSIDDFNSFTNCVLPKATKLYQVGESIADSTADDEGKTELEREIEERNEAIDELSGILGGSLSCPSIVPSGKSLIKVPFDNLI